MRGIRISHRTTVPAVTEDAGVREVFALSYSEDGRLLACAHNDGAVRVRRGGDGALVQTLGTADAEQLGVTDVSFRPNQLSGSVDTLACASATGELRWFEAKTGRQVRSMKPSEAGTAAGEVAAEKFALTCCTYRGDGQRLAVGGYDRAVRVVDEATGKVERTLSQGPLGVGQHGHSNRVFAVAWDNSPWAGGNASHILASGGWDKTVRIWDLRCDDRNACVRALFGPEIHGDALAAAGGLLLSAAYRPSSRDPLQLWDIGTAKPIQTVKWPPSGRDRVPCTLMCGAFGPCEVGRLPTLFGAGGGVGSNEARVYRLDAANSAVAQSAAEEPLRVVSPDGVNAEGPSLVPRAEAQHVGTMAGMPGAVFSIAFGPNDTVACAGGDGGVRLFGIIHVEDSSGGVAVGSGASGEGDEAGVVVMAPEVQEEESETPKGPSATAVAHALGGGSETPKGDTGIEGTVDDAEEIAKAAVKEKPRTAAAVAPTTATAASDTVVSGSGLRAAKALAAQRRSATSPAARGGGGGGEGGWAEGGGEGASERKEVEEDEE